MTRRLIRKHIHLFAALTLLVGAAIQLRAQGPAFTCQGRLKDGTGLANGITARVKENWF